MLIDANGEKYGTKSKAGDAGTDLMLDQEFVELAPGDRELLHTGAYVDVDSGALDGGVGLVFGRSGLAHKYGLTLANSVGVIDSDYRGEVKVALHNDSLTPRFVDAGERVAQALVLQVPEIEFEEVEELTDTERGAGGFGSTGK